MILHIKARVNCEKHTVEILKPITNQWVGVRYYGGCVPKIPSHVIQCEVHETVAMRLGHRMFTLDWIV